MKIAGEMSPKEALAELQRIATPQVGQAMGLSPEEVISQAEKNRKLLASMKEDVHYGVIPGTPKRTLYKAGAELLALMYQYYPEYEIERCVEDADHIHYVVRCTLYHRPTGRIVATGLGSCNSWEVKYRYRSEARTCPECGKEAIIKGKKDYGGGWLCWKKHDGCGWKFNDGDKAIEDQTIGKVENPDPWDQANTLLKMAEIRAYRGVVKEATGSSDIFTQDLEPPGDAPPPQTPKEPQPDSEAYRQQVADKAQQLAQSQGGNGRPMTDQQKRRFQEVLKSNFPDDRIRERIKNFLNSPHTSQEARTAMDWIEARLKDEKEEPDKPNLPEATSEPLHEGPPPVGKPATSHSPLSAPPDGEML